MNGENRSHAPVPEPIKVADRGLVHDKRNFIDGKGDIPDIIHNFRKRYEANLFDRKGKCFFVPVGEIKENGYDLSISKYKEKEYKKCTRCVF